MKWFVSILTLFGVSRALAFPEMVRHGYTQCTACHYSLVGGGQLNDYGRSLSRELVSQPTLAGRAVTEGDENFLSGFVQTPEWLKIGGDLRLLQTFTESKQASKGRFLIMQVELQSQFILSPRWELFLSVGRIEPRVSDPTAKDFVSSSTHGAQFLISDPEAANRWTFRAGRFMPAYGILFSEHTYLTRTLLDFGPGQERYAGELAWVNDKWAVIATQITSQARDNQIKDENGQVIQVIRAIGEKSRIGANLYQTRREEKGEKYDRTIQGVFGQFAIGEKWALLTEIDRPKGQADHWGLVETSKLNYEWHQGLNLFAVHEFANLNVENADPRSEAYGVGTQWFPRPHWDLFATFRKERNTAISDDYQDAVWLIGHYYL